MDSDQLEALIGRCLLDFYERRLQKMRELKLRVFLRRKNPYLFKALGIQRASEIVERVLDDYISASDETIFGDAFFEPIARIVSEGKASDAEGVDFVIETGERITAIALKSGPNIYNASQKKRQSQEFNAVRSRLYKLHKPFDPILGHAYGRLKTEPTKDRLYRDLSGQAFWTEITGDSSFYLKLIRLMKDLPAKYKKEYTSAKDTAINRFTAEFIKDFCHADGGIHWEKLVHFVSEDRATKLA
ncbi:MAG: cytoplasmic protein [Chloroflexi bacterium RBG_16_60_22]|nr:MAG: cytoplasmic protein [Chloroflexi bacterium RBG_16_60_22]